MADALTEMQKKSAVASLMSLTEKRDESIKTYECTDGQKQRKYIPTEKAASSTVTVESILITAAIDAKEEREVAVMELPIAF